MENTIENDSQNSIPIRGAIKVDISTSTENLIAGEEFSVFVTVKNPFEVPIILNRVSTYLPTEFIDIDQRRREMQIENIEREIQKYAEQQGINTLFRQRSFLERIVDSFSSISFQVAGIRIDFHRREPDGPSIARDLSSPSILQTLTQATFSLSLPIVGEIAQSVSTRENDVESPEEQANRIQGEQQIRSTTRQELNQFQETLNSMRTLQESAITLQPGNSTTRMFVIRTSRIVRFKPATYKLNLEIEYEIHGTRNIDTIETNLHARSAITSMIYGALLGGLGGWVAKTGTNIRPDVATFASLGVSLLITVMTIVLFARRKDVQTFVTIEDFWGGVAIGFIVAYAGQNILENLVNVEVGSG